MRFIKRSQRRQRQSLCVRSFLPAALVLVVSRSPLRAMDALDCVPADVAGVVEFRDLEGSSREINAFFKKIGWDYGMIDVEALGAILGLEPGSIDTSKPIQLILFRPGNLLSLWRLGSTPEDDQRLPLVAFIPKDAGHFARQVQGREDALTLERGANGEYFLLMRQGVAFVSKKRRQLRAIRKAEPDQCLLAAFDKDINSMRARSDVFLHLPLQRWREKIHFPLFLAANALKLAVSAQGDPDHIEVTHAYADWFSKGALKLVGQMQSATLGLDFDGKTFRLDHHFVFTPCDSVADYLHQVSRTGRNLWAPLPDRPFYFAAVLDWKCPAEVSVLQRFMKHFFSLDFVAQAIPEEKRRRRLLKYSLESYEGLGGMQVMFTSDPGRMRPLQMFGGHVLDDAPAALEKTRFLQENAGDLMAVLLPGGSHCIGKLRERRDGRVRYLEMKFDLAGTPEDEEWREAMATVYGTEACFREAVADEHQLVYSLAKPPRGVTELLATMESGKHLGRNAVVKRIRSRLPEEANAVVLLDIGRVLAMSTDAAAAMRAGKKASARSVPAPVAEAKASDKVGPLLGWSCRVRGNALNCRLAMDGKDILGLCALAGLCPSVSAEEDASTSAAREDGKAPDGHEHRMPSPLP